jgi:hypothetical protein
MYCSVELYSPHVAVGCDLHYGVSSVHVHCFMRKNLCETETCVKRKRKQFKSLAISLETGFYCKFFLFAIVSGPAVGLTQPLIQWIPIGLSPGVKWQVREADHSTLSSVEINNSRSYTSTPPIILNGVVLN